MINDVGVYGADSIGFIKYADDYGLIVNGVGEIKELPDKFFPQALAIEIKTYLEKLTIV